MKRIVLLLQVALPLGSVSAQTNVGARGLDSILKKLETEATARQSEQEFISHEEIIEARVMPVGGLVETDPRLLIGQKVTAVHLNGKPVFDTTKKAKAPVNPTVDSLLRRLVELDEANKTGKSEGRKITRVLIHDGNIRDTSKTPNILTIHINDGPSELDKIRTMLEPASISLSDYMNQTDIYGDHVPHFLTPKPAKGQQPVVTLF